MNIRRGLLIIALAMMFAACRGGAHQEKAMTPQEALSEVKQLVDATITAVAPNAPLTPDAVSGGTTCESSLTGPTGQRSYGYGFSFPVPDEATGEKLVRETSEFWKEAGHEVSGDMRDEYSPSVRISEGGFQFRAIFARQTLNAHIGGSTPCVDPLPDDA